MLNTCITENKDPTFEDEGIRSKGVKESRACQRQACISCIARHVKDFGLSVGSA